ncbi:hypothetical protein HYC85_023534, partial [Camellia sinensis]
RFYGYKFYLQQSRGCLGCCTKPPLIIAADKPSKRLRIRGRTVKKSSISEDFWSTSTCEMDNSIVQSQRSGSSMSTSNPPLDPHSSAGSTSNPTEFVLFFRIIQDSNGLEIRGLQTVHKFPNPN